MTWTCRTALLVALVFLVTAGPARAESPSTVATAVSHNVMSPFCPGLTLHDCPSDAAAALRARIESWAREGRSRTEIMARLRAEYGPSIAASPEPRGRGLVAWLVPVAAVLVGAAVVTAALRRWNEPAGALPRRRELSSDERARLDRELTRIRGEV
jgi:cytochrome c-type biogenesis protein CcmH/NrfF